MSDFAEGLISAVVGGIGGGAKAAANIYKTDREDASKVDSEVQLEKIRSEVLLDRQKRLDEHKANMTDQQRQAMVDRISTAQTGMLQDVIAKKANAENDYTTDTDKSPATYGELQDEDQTNPAYQPTDQEKTDAYIRAAIQTGDTKTAQEASAADASRTNSQANLAYKSALGNIAQQRNDIRQQLADTEQQRADTYQQRADQTGDNPLTKSQMLKNKEIDLARRKVAGLSEQEIKLKTSKFTPTGRANIAYDPLLATRLKLAGKRKYGDDDIFDSALDDGSATPATPSVTSNSVLDRFASDSAMSGMKPGRATPDGIEVFDSTGRLVGHYR